MLIWNVRTSPRLTRSCGSRRGDVVVAEEDLAAVGPQHAGHQVDQRGLAGAVRADQRVALAARQIDLDVACATTSEPKLLSSPRVESAGALTCGSTARGDQARQPAEDAVRQEDHDGDQQRTDPEVPVLRIDAGELVARHHVDDGADDAAIEPPGAAQDRGSPARRRSAGSSASRARRSRWSAPAARRRCRP